MERKRKKLSSVRIILLLLTAFILVFAGKAVFRIVLAYQTDSGTLANAFIPGHNTTQIEEEFPKQFLTPGESMDIQKKVRICNEQDARNVSCYVRAKILYSTEDFGNYTIQGMSSKWKQGTDGYYYYTEKVPAGGATEYLMTGIHVDSSKAISTVSGQKDSLEIYIYEESCQTKHPDTQKDRTWQEAWEHALGRKIG